MIIKQPVHEQTNQTKTEVPIDFSQKVNGFQVASKSTIDRRRGFKPKSYFMIQERNPLYTKASAILKFARFSWQNDGKIVTKGDLQDIKALSDW